VASFLVVGTAVRSVTASILGTEMGFFSVLQFFLSSLLTLPLLPDDDFVTPHLLEALIRLDSLLLFTLFFFTFFL
jgi:hypothetical protein